MALGWWIVESTACPLSANLRKKAHMDQELWESSPLVGSSKNKSNAGLAASSTPIVRSFLCSTFNPSPGVPTTASAKSSMLSIFITSSTYTYFSLLETLSGWRSTALNRKASRTVDVGR
jgi:hypothetical protein